MSERPDIEAYNGAVRSVNAAQKETAFMVKSIEFSDGKLSTTQALQHLINVCTTQQLAIKDLVEAVGILLPNTKGVEE